MKFGIIGLGRMGSNIARHALEQGQAVVGFDSDERLAEQVASEGLEPANSIAALASKLERPRIVFLYVPHGQATEAVCEQLRPLLETGDVVVDGGNSHWEDSKRRYGLLAQAGIRFLDVGTSGGIAGARHGACFMAGGDREAYEQVEPILKHLAVDEQGTTFVGGPGAGHFTKLIHNAIEFGIVQSIAEGVELLKGANYDLDLPALFENWMHGSVIRSWLLELMGNALRQHSDFGNLSTYVEDTEEVKWVLQWALERDIPTPVVASAQEVMMEYRDRDWPAAKSVALLRNQYGGHPVHTQEEGLSRS
jgi:6-phosphogluconate dehydrogenase